LGKGGDGGGDASAWASMASSVGLGFREDGGQVDFRACDARRGPGRIGRLEDRFHQFPGRLSRSRTLVVLLPSRGAAPLAFLGPWSPSSPGWPSCPTWPSRAQREGPWGDTLANACAESKKARHGSAGRARREEAVPSFPQLSAVWLIPRPSRPLSPPARNPRSTHVK